MRGRVLVRGIRSADSLRCAIVNRIKQGSLDGFDEGRAS